MSGKSLAIYSSPRLNKSPPWEWPPARSHIQICLQFGNLEFKLLDLDKGGRGGAPNIFFIILFGRDPKVMTNGIKILLAVKESLK